MASVATKRLLAIVRMFDGLPDREKWIVLFIEALIENPQTQFGEQRAQFAAAAWETLRTKNPTLTKQQLARLLATGKIGKLIGLNSELSDVALAGRVRQMLRQAQVE